MRTQKEVEDEKDLIQHMLDEIQSHFEQKGASNGFIESIREQFDKWQSLSPKQIEGIRKFYERIC